MSLVELSTAHEQNFQSAACRRVMGYWRSRSDNNSVPHWHDIQLVDLQRDLGHIIVQDLVDDGQNFRIRFFGEDLAQHFGDVSTGTLLEEALSCAELASFKEGLQQVSQNNEPVRLTFTRFNGMEGKIEVALLPLLGNNGDDPAHILCLMDFA